MYLIDYDWVYIQVSKKGTSYKTLDLKIIPFHLEQAECHNMLF